MLGVRRRSRPRRRRRRPRWGERKVQVAAWQTVNTGRGSAFFEEERRKEEGVSSSLSKKVLESCYARAGKRYRWRVKYLVNCKVQERVWRLLLLSNQQCVAIGRARAAHQQDLRPTGRSALKATTE